MSSIERINALLSRTPLFSKGVSEKIKYLTAIRHDILQLLDKGMEKEELIMIIHDIVQERQ